MIRFGLLGALALSGCSFFDRGACDSLATEICDACDVTSYTEDTMCACLSEGEVDNASKYFANKDQAEQWCYRLQQDVKATYNTDETVKQCKADYDYIKEYEDEACVDLGYEAARDTGW
jgi:hypothetical protein